MSAAECRSFEQKLAYHLSPCLLGIKCAGLISVSNKEFLVDEQIRRFNTLAKKRGLKIRQLCTDEDRVLILLYKYDLLRARLTRERDFLARYGYPKGISVDRALDILSLRISQSTDFPHEIGIFLDYPIEDVKGFICNKGQNCLLCGYWKVYGDVDKSRMAFESYDRCREYVCGKLKQGCDLYQALKIS